MIYGPRNALRLHRERIQNRKTFGEYWQHGFYFVDVPRTSSTAIRSELIAKFGIRYAKDSQGLDSDKTLMPPHLTVQQLHAIFGRRHFNRLYTFAVVRNPWDRQLSLFGYMRNNDIIPHNLSFLDYLKAMEQRDERWFQYAPYHLPAAAYITDGSRIAINQIVFYEDRERGLSKVRDVLGITQLGERKENGFARPQRYAEAYCDEGREIVARTQVDDLRLFGYEFAA